MDSVIAVPAVAGCEYLGYESAAVGVAELVYGRRRALVIPKVEFDRPHRVLI